MIGGGRTRALRVTLALVALGGVLWAALASLFVVDVTEWGVVTRYGHVVRVVAEPGLHVKLPIDLALALDKRLLETIPETAEYLSADQKNLVVDSLVLWRIADAKRFLATLRDRASADSRLNDIVLAAIGSTLGRVAFDDLITPDGANSRFAEMVADIGTVAASMAAENFGIEIVDVRLRRLRLPEQNQQYVFQRMQGERGKIAMGYRSEGEQLGEEIKAVAERERTRILAEAYREAVRIRGQADAEAMRIYADNFGRNPAFYKFVRTLAAYETILDQNTTVFLPADADIYRALRDDVPDRRPNRASNEAVP